MGLFTGFVEGLSGRIGIIAVLKMIYILRDGCYGVRSFLDFCADRCG